MTATETCLAPNPLSCAPDWREGLERPGSYASKCAYVSVREWLLVGGVPVCRVVERSPWPSCTNTTKANP